MQSVGEKVKISQQAVVRDVLLRVEDKPMKAVLYKAKGKDACQCCHYKTEKIEGLPGRDPIKEVSHHGAGDVGNVIPLIMS